MHVPHAVLVRALMLGALLSQAPAYADSAADQPPPAETEPPPAPLSPPPEPPPPPPRKLGNSLLPDTPSGGVGRSGNLADTYVARGVEYFRRGQYDQAVDELRKAYLVRRKPIYLFNIGQAYRRGGRPQEALEAYQEFLQEDPQTKLRAETEGYIGDVKALLDEQRRRKSDLQRATMREEQTQQDLLLARQRAERAERERRRPAYKKGWFWGVMVTTVAAVGAGIALAVVFTRDPQTDGGIVSLHF